MPLIVLDYWDLAIAALLLAVNAGLSIWLQLGLARDTLIAALRMVVQLGLIGLVLKLLFTIVSPFWTALFALMMILFAGREAMARQERRLAGWWGYGVGTTAMLAAAAIVTETLARVPPLRPLEGSPAEALAIGLTGANTTTTVSFASEAGQFQEAGVPAVLCGPGSVEQAHQPNEFIALEQIEACEKFLRKLIEHARTVDA